MVPDRCSTCGHDGYRSPSLTVDAIATRTTNHGIEVLMIKRGHSPPEWENLWAFPGGFVEYGEDPIDAVIRELVEETGMVGRNPVLFSVLGSPGRDPPKHCVGLFYTVDVDMETDPLAGDDAVHSEWVRIEDLNRKNVAGDHIEIIERIRNPV